MRYLVVLLAALLVPVAGAAASPSPPGTLTAQAQCKAQGYAVGTQDFAACIARQLSGSPKKTTPTTSPTTQPSATLAKAVCRGLGLTRGTQAFTRCLNLQAKRLRHTKGVAPGTP